MIAKNAYAAPGQLLQVELPLKGFIFTPLPSSSQSKILKQKETIDG